MRIRSRTAAFLAALAAVTYGPLLLSARGMVAADTKQYLYLDPGRLLSRAAWLWDPNVGAGTVTHQNIGYLFPMGPWFWLADAVRLPDWVAQRLWMGSLLFLAGAGVWFLLRTLDVDRPGAELAAVVYALSPYSLDYIGRISAILLPWAAMPWLVALTVLALRRGGWRHPALLALVALTVGGVNATSLLYAAIAPAAWLVVAAVTREASWRDALGTAGRTALLVTGVSAWWIAGLVMQARYGLPVLQFTESVETVAKTSLSSEVLRGLGYWFFYGRDKLGPWIEASIPFTQNVKVIALSFVAPVLAFVAAAFGRSRARTFFLVLIVAGTAIAVGAYPYGHPEPLGALFKAASDRSAAGLAMRSTARAVPLVALGVAGLLALGAAALRARTPRVATGATAALAGLVVIALVPLWQGTMIDRNLRRPETIPAYWREAAVALDAGNHETRVLEVPGADFAAYNWGNTVDPITPGLIDRPYLARELIPSGQPGSADLLIALDRRMQEGVFEPASLAPIARRFAAGEVVYRGDLQFERYNTPRPRLLWPLLRVAPGLDAPRTFGTAGEATPVRFPMIDELALAAPQGDPAPPPVATMAVRSPVSIVHAAPAARPVVLDGDGEGMVDAAAIGLLDQSGVLRYAASLDASQLDGALADGAHLVVTDTNRRRARRWSTVRENTGYTERAGERPLERDAKDARLAVLPSRDDASRTVVEQRGVASVAATDYGNTISYTPEDRAANALDGDVRTAWRAGAFGNPEGERLVVQFAAPVAADHLTLLQPIEGPRNRFITRATLRFDGGTQVAVDLTEQSRVAPGQAVAFTRRSFTQVELTVDRTNAGSLPSYLGWSSVGVAELSVPGAPLVEEVVRMPRDLLAAAGARSDAHRLTVLMTRLRSAPTPLRQDEEVRIARTFRLPSARRFSLSGVARLDSTRPDEAVDALLGTGATAARASTRIAGNLPARASAAFDGDPATAWTPVLGAPTGQWIEADAPRPVTIDRLALQVLADGRHSVPTQVTVTADGTSPRTIALPPVADGGAQTIPVSFAPLTGQRFRITVDAVREVRVLEYYSEQPITLPVAIAEVGSPELLSHAAAQSGGVDICRNDLLTVDGRAVPIRISGDEATAETLGALAVRTCTGAPLVVGPGDHEIRTAPGRDTGIHLDRLVLDSAPVRPSRDVTTSVPELTVRRSGHLSYEIDVPRVDAPFWLVLGQSRSDGWRASVAGHGGLGSPELVDGYANGWRIDPAAVGSGSIHISLDWTPQQGVWLALALSVLTTLICLAIVLVSGRRRRRTTTKHELRAETGQFGGENALSSPVALVGAGFLAAAGVYTAVQQARYRYPPAFEWPTFFPLANTLGWIAVLLLAASLFRLPRVFRRRAARDSGEPPGPM